MRQIGSSIAVVAVLAGTGMAPARSAETPAAPAPATVPPSPPSQSGAAAWAAIVGNTIDGRVAGQDFSDFFEKAGTVRHVDQNGLSSGTWTAQDDKICLDFPEDDERNCLRFEVTGTTGTALDDDGETARFTILPGNAKGL